MNRDTKLGLLDRYDEPHRHYHNLDHIYACIKHLDRLALTLPLTGAQYEIIEMAIWFHDAIYVPMAGDNEERSASLIGHDFWADGLVAEMVLATKIHKIPFFIEKEDLDMFKWFLDIDLSILGALSEEYLNYSIDIRKEYASVPSDQYTAGRKQVLHSFLSRDRIYMSDYFHELLEVQARENIKEELLGLG